MSDRFRTEWLLFEDGTFVTEQELKFFQARPNGQAMVERESPEFRTYINKCRVHNFLYELGDDCGSFFWDSATEKVTYMVRDESILDTLDVLGLLEYLTVSENE